jgi:hypothetical protein
MEFPDWAELNTPPTEEEWSEYLTFEQDRTVEEMLGLLTPAISQVAKDLGIMCAHTHPSEVHLMFAVILGQILFDAEMQGPAVSLEQRLALFCVHVRNSYRETQFRAKTENLYHKSGEVS